MEVEDSGVGSHLVGVQQAPNPPGVPKGLHVIPNWISEEQEQEIVTFLCAGQWETHMSSKRPTQHFGYRYTIQGYGSSVDKIAKDWGVFRNHADRIEKEFPGIKIVQCLANLYSKDTTIGAHRDKETPIVFGISVAGDTNMIWTNIRDKSLKYEALVPRRSLYIMCDDAAFEWKHEVPGRKTVKYPDLTPGPNYGQLTTVVKKPDWYTRCSITFRHFLQPLEGEDRLAPQLPQPAIKPLEACHLRGVIPMHQENVAKLFAEHPWQEVPSRFGTKLSRLICGDSTAVSPTSAIYASWVELFCERILGVRVHVRSSFANLYADGNAALPAHRDQYACWIFGLSFGETRTFDFITDSVKPTIKTSVTPGDITSIPMESGDVLLFSPGMNDTHRHRILKEPSRKGKRINLTYFIDVLPGQDESRLINPPEIKAESIPTFEEASRVQRDSYDREVAEMIPYLAEALPLLEVEVDGERIKIESMEELVANISHFAPHRN